MAVWRVPFNLAWDGPGTPGVNVFHLRTAGPDDGAQLQLGVDAIRAFYHACNGAGTANNSVFPIGYAVTIDQAVNVEDQSTLQPTFTALGAPGLAPEAPQLLQVCVSWRTSIAARRGMGRTFVGPLGAWTMQSDGTISATAATAIRNAATGLVSASLTDNGWAAGVWGLESAAPAGTTDFAALPHVLRDFTASSVRDRFAVLRSRRD